MFARAGLIGAAVVAAVMLGVHAVAARHAKSDGAAGATTAASPARIVSLAPHVTDLLLAAGLGHRLVGVSESCELPAGEPERTRVASHAGVNIEAVIALAPDIVIAWPSGQRALDLAALRRHGLRVETSDPRRLEDIPAEIERFAAWGGPDQSAKARSMAADLRARLARWRASATESVVSVFYQLGPERLFTLSDRHFIGDALAICGARNVFGARPEMAPEVSREAVLAAGPDAVLIASPSALERVIGDWRRDALPAALAQPPRVRPVDGRRLHRPTPATFDAVDQMCAEIARVRRAIGERR